MEASVIINPAFAYLLIISMSLFLYAMVRSS